MRDGVSLVHTVVVDMVLQNTQPFWFNNFAIMLDVGSNYDIHGGTSLWTVKIGSLEYYLPELLASLHICTPHIVTLTTLTDIYNDLWSLKMLSCIIFYLILGKPCDVGGFIFLVLQ